MGWVGNKGNDINWDGSPVSSPATVLIHCGEVNKVKVKVKVKEGLRAGGFEPQMSTRSLCSWLLLICLTPLPSNELKTLTFLMKSC